MIAALIRWSSRNIVLVLLGSLLAAAAGVYALSRLPLDALPDLSDTQVIIYTEYSGQAPQVVENQVTYPLTTAMLGVPRARTVRGFSMFGVSFVYVIFADGTDVYWARTRVLEYLSGAARRLPPGVVPTLGPDSSGVGWVYQYALTSDRHSLAELRSLQDWYLRFALIKAEGVTEVAGIGGFVKQYNVVVDPLRLQSLGIRLQDVSAAIAGSNLDVGGRTVEMSETEYAIRGRGYLQGIDDLRTIALKTASGMPVRLGDVARISIGPDERRGISELNGTGEAVGGIALQRFGTNALDVIRSVKDEMAQAMSGLPDGVSVVPVYDRSELIYRAIDTLKRTLLEESIVVALVCAVFLLHLRSALVAIVMLPVGILMAFAAMKWLGMGSNLMSLGGIAIAIGAMVDAAIVMIENAHKHLERAPKGKPRLEIMTEAAIEVGPALFFSLLIITVSFLPVFTLEAQEGRLFQPLAFTKTFAMAAAALLSVTLVPVLMILFIRGHVRPEAENPVNRWLIRSYRPVLTFALRRRLTVIGATLLILAATWWPLSKLGSEFMPSLNEGTLLFMPTTLPGISVTETTRILQLQDRIIKSFPEVESVFGKAGRANTATDPAPLEMSETLINLKPDSEWRPGMTVDKLVAEMNEALQFPGVSNAWTMPIRARIDMLSTGIRTPVGIKLTGNSLEELETSARQIEAVVRKVPGTTSAFAERAGGGFFIDITPDRQALSRYGLSMQAVQMTIATALGGESVTTTVEGRERYSVNVRYPQELRRDPQAMAREIRVDLPDGGTLPLGEIARIDVKRGAANIRTEDARLALYIYIDVQGRDLGRYVSEAKEQVSRAVTLPPGMTLIWSGQFEYMERAMAKLKLVVPLTLFIIFILLFMNFRRLTETLIVMLSLPFALVGGLWLMYFMGFNLSVAAAVGFIALAGVAAETGVIMLIYLDHALAAGPQPPSRQDIERAVMIGAVERVRPKMMTVCAILGGLLPILWNHGTGAEVMQRIAVPMIGGMISSALLTLIVIPVLYVLIKSGQRRIS